MNDLMVAIRLNKKKVLSLIIRDTTSQYINVIWKLNEWSPERIWNSSFFVITIYRVLKKTKENLKACSSKVS